MNDDPGATPTAACPRCRRQVSIEEDRCPACRWPLWPRLQVDHRLPAYSSLLLWWGLVPPLTALAAIQIGVGLAAGWTAARFAWYETTFATLGAVALGGCCSVGPLTIALGLSNRAARIRALTGRHRLVAILSIPLTLVSLVPLLGVLPALLAQSDPGPRPDRRSPRHGVCPCGYALPDARHVAATNCSECGLALSWTFTNGGRDQESELAGLVGALGLLLLVPISVVVSVATDAPLVLAGAASGVFGVAVLRELRAHRTSAAPALRPSRWRLVGVSPMVVAAILGVIAGVS